jgi:energy-coupling factor transporter ATP-binding protein EcfA2
MQKEFSLSNDKVMINFTAKYCDTPEKLLSSNGFQRILSSYISIIQKKNSMIYKFLVQSLNLEEPKLISSSLTTVFKMLVALSSEEIIQLNSIYQKLLTDKDMFIDFIEDLYKYWRKLERYTIIHNYKINEGLEKVSFIDANTNFSNLILNLYRRVEENVIGYQPNVYRQLPAGGNAGLILNNIPWPFPLEYTCLKDVPFIESIILDVPFITYPKRNTRDGIFSETHLNPLKNCSINPDHWFCYPAKVGSLLAYIYFHRDFMAHGTALCNLFEIAKKDEYMNKKPDIVYVFGAREKDKTVKTIFYDDVENDIMLGYVTHSDLIDYFGYMKKMTLTLHNLIMIKRGYLPVHGAMVNIKLKTGKSANIILVGDSGAGKSETLEAFRSLSEKYISDMTIIFDDMGVVKTNGYYKPLAYGTEIGAFVRLDDLEPGYAFRELDRSIFMNPDKINARLVIPVTTYKDILKGYPVDMFLYANNYDDGSEIETLEYFDHINEAISVFREGARMAKGTTTEKGLVKSYFANPFGPLQRREETDKLLYEYFREFFYTGVKVGQLRTCLGITGKEKEGPKNAAIKLFEAINEL